MHTKHKQKKVDDSTNVTEDELKVQDKNMNGELATENVELKVVDLKTESAEDAEHQKKIEKYHSWKRMILLIIAITVHNIPGNHFKNFFAE